MTVHPLLWTLHRIQAVVTRCCGSIVGIEDIAVSAPNQANTGVVFIGYMDTDHSLKDGVALSISNYYTLTSGESSNRGPIR